MPLGRNWSCKQMYPSNGFREDLAEIPRGSRVGLAIFDPSQAEEIYLKVLNNNRPLREKISPFVPMPNGYWHDLVWVLRELELEPVYLRDEADLLTEWSLLNALELAENNVLRYNEQEAKRIELGEIPTGFSREQANLVKLMKHAEIRLKHHNIKKRNDGLLEKLTTGKLDSTVAELKDSDYWIAHDRLPPDTTYSADVLPELVTNKEPENVFQPTRTNFTMSYVVPSVEHQHRYIETGNFTSETPDFVGTFYTGNPVGGYFELFLHDVTAPNGFAGKCLDQHGTSIVSGKRSADEITFKKVYSEASEGIQRPISFKYKLRDGLWVGEWDEAGSTVMAEAPSADMLDLIERYQALRK